MLTKHLKELQRATNDLLITVNGFETLSSVQIKELYAKLTMDNIVSIRFELNIIEKENGEN